MGLSQFTIQALRVPSGRAVEPGGTAPQAVGGGWAGGRVIRVSSILWEGMGE